MARMAAGTRLARVLSSGLVVAALALYILVGHAAHATNVGMKSMHGDGICLVLFVVALGFAVATFRAAPPRPRVRPPAQIAPRAAAAPSPLPLLPARASPSWLQVSRR